MTIKNDKKFINTRLKIIPVLKSYTFWFTVLKTFQEWDHKSVILLLRDLILHNEPMTSDVFWRSAGSGIAPCPLQSVLAQVACAQQPQCCYKNIF